LVTACLDKGPCGGRGEKKTAAPRIPMDNMSLERKGREGRRNDRRSVQARDLLGKSKGSERGARRSLLRGKKKASKIWSGSLRFPAGSKRKQKRLHLNRMRGQLTKGGLPTNIRPHQHGKGGWSGYLKLQSACRVEEKNKSPGNRRAPKSALQTGARI